MSLDDDDDDDDDEREPLVTRRAKEAVNMLKSNPVSPRENVERYYECIELLRERRKRAARDADGRRRGGLGRRLLPVDVGEGDRVRHTPCSSP